jgi:hypothetical protein
MTKPHIRWWRGHWEIRFERGEFPYLAIFNGTLRAMGNWWWKLTA